MGSRLPSGEGVTVMLEDFVSLAEAATRKGVHYQTVRRAIMRGNLNACKVGGGVLIAVTDLDAWEPQYKHVPRRYRHGPSDGVHLDGQVTSG